MMGLMACRGSITICVPTAREAYPKRGTIADLVEPAIARLPVAEIVVVGQPGRSFVKEPEVCGVPMRVLYDSNIERANLRNRALKAVGTELLMYLDDDTILVPHTGFRNTLGRCGPTTMLTFAERRHLPLSSSLRSFQEKARRLTWSRGMRRCTELVDIPWREREWYTAEIAFPTNFCIIGRSARRATSGLNPRFRGWGYEDVEFANRVLRRGKIISCREIATAVHIDHHIDPTRDANAFENYQLFLEDCRRDQTLPRASAMYFGVATRFLSTIHPLYRMRREQLERCLLKVPRFKQCPRDLTAAASAIEGLGAAVDVIAIGITGSGKHLLECRDVDLCVVAGYCQDRFQVDELPSGIPLELQLTSLSSIRSQLRMLFYLGDSAHLLYQKWGSMRFLHDHKRIASRYVRMCLTRNPLLRIHLASFYAGCAYLYLIKREGAEQTAI